MSMLQVSAPGTVSHMEPERNNPVEKNNTDMNEILHGSIPRGKSLIYYTQPGVDGEIFGMQTAYNTLKCGGRCIFVASSASPGIIKSQFIEMGWDIEPFKNRLLFVDAYSQLIGAQSREKYVVPAPDNIDNLNKTIVDLLKESPASTMVFGSLSTIMDLCGEKNTIEAVRLWNKMAALYGHVLVYNFTAWPYSREILNSINEDLFNTVICIGGITKGIPFGKYLGILKSDWISNKKYVSWHRPQEFL